MELGSNAKLAVVLFVSCFACRYCFLLGRCAEERDEAANYEQCLDTLKTRMASIDRRLLQHSDDDATKPPLRQAALTRATPPPSVVQASQSDQKAKSAQPPSK